MRSFAVLFRALVLAIGSFAASGLALSSGLPIIVYHQIRNTPDGPPDSLEAIALDRFEAQMRYLHENGYVTLSANEVLNYLRSDDPGSQKVVAIHFDDGWKSAQLALPALDRYGFKATFWIISGSGIGMPHMDWEEIKAIARNPRYDIYSHTMTHPWKRDDTMLDWMNRPTVYKGPDQVRWELAESRKIIAEKLQREVPYLAWPAGHYNEDMIRIAQESGYIALFTVDSGVNYPGDSPLRIKRTTIHGGCDDEAFKEILRDGVYRNCRVDATAHTP